MSRVERKNQEKNRKERPKYGFVLIFFIVIIVINGIIIVDEASRNMLMMEEAKAFGYKKINDHLHQVYLCGQAFYIDEIKIRVVYQDIKNEVQGLWKQLKSSTE